MYSRIREHIHALWNNQWMRGGSWLGIGQLGIAGASFLQLIIVTNLLSKPDFGIYKYIITLASLIIAVALTGYAGAIIQEAARDVRALREGTRTTRWWSVASSIVALLGGLYYLAVGNNTLGISMFVIGAITPLRVGWEIAPSYLAGLGKYKLSAITLTVPSLSILILTTALAYLYNTPLVVAIGYLGGILLGAGIGYAIAQRYAPGNEGADPETAGYAKHLSVSNALTIVSSQVESLLVFHYLGARELAIFAIATSIPTRIQTFAKLLPSLFIRQFTHLAKQAAVARQMLVVFLGSSVLVVVIYTILPLLINLFFPQYQEAVQYARLFLIGTPFLVTTLIPLSWFQAKRLHTPIYLFTVVGIIIKISAIYLGITWNQLDGLAASRVIGQILLCIIVLVLYLYFRNQSTSDQHQKPPIATL